MPDTKRTRGRMTILVLDADDVFVGYLRMIWATRWPAALGALPHVHAASTAPGFAELIGKHPSAELALITPSGDGAIQLVPMVRAMRYAGPVIGYSTCPVRVAEMHLTGGFARVLGRAGIVDPALLVVGPLPRLVVSSGQAVGDEVRAGSTVARHRFFAPDSPLELYVLALDDDRRIARCAVIAPGGKLSKELVDLAELGGFAERHGCDRIVWDGDFVPAAFDEARVDSGRHPIAGRKLRG